VKSQKTYKNECVGEASKFWLWGLRSCSLQLCVLQEGRSPKRTFSEPSVPVVASRIGSVPYRRELRGHRSSAHHQRRSVKSRDEAAERLNMKQRLRIWFSGAAVVLLAGATYTLLGFGGFEGAANASTIQAIRANDFLESLGACTHIIQGMDSPISVQAGIRYLGVRNIRDDGTTNRRLIRALCAIHSKRNGRRTAPQWGSS
jgi:hypothetical protein